jgi:hypothetical protein
LYQWDTSCRKLALELVKKAGPTKQMSRGFGREKKFETKPVIRVDLALEVLAPPRGEIRTSSIRELLYQLRDLGKM